MRRRVPQGVLFGVSMVIAVATVIALAFLERRTRHQVIASIDMVTHTLEVQRAWQAVEMTLTDAETGQRGFLLAGTRRYLAPYDRARETLTAQIETLRLLTADNAAQRYRVDRLRALSGEKMRELQDTITLTDAGRKADALQVVNTGEGQMLMEHVRAQVRDGLQEENGLLQGRQGALQAALSRRAQLTGGALVVVVAAMGIAFYFLFKVQRAEQLVTMCAWSKTIQDGEEWISFDEYLERRFNFRVSHGISPQEFEKLESRLGEARTRPA